ncbi:MAG: MFS transporter [Candidatus Lokiarchaeota archaeon]|nr:MFS transporter [Candidatus Lokiarchaeota archaeon]
MSENTSKIDYSQLDGWEKRNKSHWTMSSYAFGSFAVELVGNSFGALYFFFYETELYLGPAFLLAANVLFAIWNAVNDPLLGFISERKRPFWKKWGKRGLWTAICIPLLYISYLAVFTPPGFLIPTCYTEYCQPAWFFDYILFLWLFVMLCLADTFYSLFYVHWFAQFPEKFQDDATKRKANVWRLYLAIAAVLVGNLLPPLLYEYDDIRSYGMMALVIGAIALIPSAGVLYGTRQSPRRKAIEWHEDEEKQESFWKYLKLGLATKSYVAYLCFYVGNKIWDQFVLGTLPYWNKYVLVKDPDSMTILLALFIIGQLVSVPVWTIISKKIGFRKTMIYAGFGQALLTTPFIFITDYTVSMPFFFIAGFGNGGMWTMLAPVFAEVLDELSIKTKKRDSGVFVGINVFFGRLMIIVFTAVTLIVHILTNFDETLPFGQLQNPAATFGIRGLLAIVPSVGLAIFIGLFALIYDIKGDKKKMIEQKKAELGI